MKTIKSGNKSIIASVLVVILAVFLLIPGPGNAFFKKPWAHLETEYLKEVASSDLTYFDGEWKGTLECGSFKNFPRFMQYRKFTIKNGRGVYVSSAGSRDQSGYRYWKIEITDTGKASIKGEYYADFLKKLEFSGQIGIDPEQYYQEVMWLKGSRGPRKCECKFVREVPLVAQKALVEKVPIYADILRKKAELEAQRLAEELEKREREEAEARLLAKKEEEQKRQEEAARATASKAAENKRKESMALDTARTLEASFTKTTRLYLQHGLQQLGYYRGKVDGAFGPGTRSAIKAYQKKTGKPTTGYLEETDVASLIALGKVVFEKAVVERQYREKEARRLAEEKAESVRQKEEARRLAEARAGSERQEDKALQLAEEKAARERNEAEALRLAKKETELQQKEATAAERNRREDEAPRLAEEKEERERKKADERSLVLEKTEQKKNEAAAAEHKHQETEARRLAEEKAERDRKQAKALRLAREKAERKQKKAAAERKRQEAEARRLAEEKAERERQAVAQLKEELKAEIKKQLEVEREKEKRLAARSSENGDNGYKFVDTTINYRTLDSEVGCHSQDPISVQNEKFARRYKNKIFVLPGRLIKLEGNSALVDLDDGQPDISIELISGQDLLDLEKEVVTIEFIMKKKGGCFSLFQGERGIVYKNNDVSAKYNN